MKKIKGITLIALVITIIILLILAGISISALSDNNGLFGRAKEAKESQIKADMREQLALALNNLQVDKLGEATLNDITQEFIDNQIKEYDNKVTDDTKITGKRVTMKKDSVVGVFIIDEKLNIIEGKSGINFEYETISITGEMVEIVIKVFDLDNGINKVECPNGSIVECEGTKDIKEIKYTVKLGQEYIFKVTSGNGETKDNTVLVNEFYYKVTKNLEENIVIDNTQTKAEYNKPYQATVMGIGEYKIDTIIVKMGETDITATSVNKTTGAINIDTVIGDIEITATAKKVEIEVTNEIIGTSNPPTYTVGDNTQTITAQIYINFSAKIGDIDCKVEPALPFKVTKNGKYKFVATAEYNGNIITKDIEISANKYQEATNLVKYDAGDWTKNEIEEMTINSLYMINTSKTTNSKYRLNDVNGLNYTFGGFTYKDDEANKSYIDNGTVITSRNQSVAPQSSKETPKYDGWQILESEEKNGRIYITKIVHAGSPENFSYNYMDVSNNGYRVEYLLSSAQRRTSYNTLKNGTIINPRYWDKYRDKELDSKEYINNVHIMTYDEANQAISKNIAYTGGYYWLGTAYGYKNQYYFASEIKNGNTGCLGIRPVVEMNENVYISGGNGTEADPYVLAKE